MKLILKGKVMLRSLRCFVALFVGAVLTTASSPALAALVFNDTFTHSDGNLVGTTPDLSTGDWTQTGTISTTPIQVASNQASLGTSGQDAYAALTGWIVPGNGIHTSLDLTVSSAQATGDYFLHLGDPVGTTTNFYQRLFAKSTTGGYLLGLTETSGTGATTTYGTTVLNLGDTYHVDINWNSVSGATNDTFDVSVGGSPYLSHTWTSVTSEPTFISEVNFRQGSASNAAAVKVDNLQVEQVPEPCSLVLCSLAGLLGLVVRQARR